jgi:hypothetical protein
VRSLDTFCCLFITSATFVMALPGFAVEVDANPAMAERLINRRAEVTTGLRRMIETQGRSQTQDLTALADTGSSAWGLYFRDRQLLFSVPVRRNVIGLERSAGEAEASLLAVTMLQQQFSQLLGLDASSELKPESVRVVFIEPNAHAALASRPPFGGIAGPPLPFAHAGSWPASISGQGPCGCR